MRTNDSRFLPNQQNLIEVNLTNADTYQLLLSVIDLSIFKVGKKPSAKSTSNISEPYSSPREGWIVDANFRLFWHQSGYAESDF